MYPSLYVPQFLVNASYIMYALFAKGNKKKKPVPMICIIIMFLC